MIDSLETLDRPSESRWENAFRAPQKWNGREWQRLASHPASVGDLGLKKSLPLSSSSFSLRERTISGSSYVRGNAAIVFGSGKLTYVAFEFDKPIHQIEFDSLGELEIIQGNINALTILADDNLIELLEHPLTGHKLELRIKPNTSIATSHPIKYRLIVSDLRQLAVAGFGTVVIPCLKASDFSCKVNGLGNVAINEGEIERQEITISGNGKYEAANVPAGHSVVRVSGSGHASLQSVHTLDVSLSGNGTCTAHGHHNPKITQSISGSGLLRHSAG